MVTPIQPCVETRKGKHSIFQYSYVDAYCKLYFRPKYCLELKTYNCNVYDILISSNDRFENKHLQYGLENSKYNNSYNCGPNYIRTNIIHHCRPLVLSRNRKTANCPILIPLIYKDLTQIKLGLATEWVTDITLWCLSKYSEVHHFIKGSRYIHSKHGDQHQFQLQRDDRLEDLMTCVSEHRVKDLVPNFISIIPDFCVHLWNIRSHA